jgi:hypothetical protein
MRYVRSALFALGLLLAVSATEAQQLRVKAEIPFDFVVGNQVLPAGEYTVMTEGAARQAIWIRSNETKASAVSIAFSSSASGNGEASKLVFHSLDGRYFLSEIWTAGYDQGLQLPKPRMEVQLAKNNPTAVFSLAANVMR